MGYYQIPALYLAGLLIEKNMFSFSILLITEAAEKEEFCPMHHKASSVILWYSMIPFLYAIFHICAMIYFFIAWHPLVLLIRFAHSRSDLLRDALIRTDYTCE